MSKASNLNEVFSAVLKQGLVLVGAIAILGGGLGLIFAGVAGLVSGLIGATLALLFSSLTALSVFFGGKLSLGGFFGVVLGGWIVKLVGFIVLIALLKGAAFIAGPVLFFTLVASILGTLVIDSRIVLKSRITIGDN
ncbi:MAG: hypothetical protein ORN27_05135 [Rhodoluna sp.]|nr:hypothetical protein [Rhodoluna sp.]